MSNKYWFEPKRFGWGFVPVTWEGWVTTLLLLILVVISVYTNGFFDGAVTPKSVLRFIFDTFLITTIFTVTALEKTEGQDDCHCNGISLFKKKKKSN
jgi:hypothetical protein